MSINRKKLVTLFGILAVGIAVASTAGAMNPGTPGVTSTQVLLGSTFPLSEGPHTGGASLYSTIYGAEAAYFGYINAKGGVHGRHIVDDVKDDQYTPSETFTDVKTLVEHDHVFAIVGSLGTAPALATWNYLNSKQIPQALLATGDSNWGACVHKNLSYCGGSVKPWTMGWQPDYPGEGRLYGKYILAHKPSAKIGVLYQNDAYGKNYLAGLKAGLGGSSHIKHTEAYTPGESFSSIKTRVTNIKNSGADTFVIFATPGASINALIAERVLGYSPLTILNNVSANRIFMLSAESHGATPDGVISTTYIKSQTVTPNDAAMKLGKQIIYATHNASLEHEWDIGDSNLVYGLAVAYTAVDALNAAGANLTRSGFMYALRHISLEKNPFIYPGMSVQTTNTRTFPMQQLIFQRWDGTTTHDWKTFGSVQQSGH